MRNRFLHLILLVANCTLALAAPQYNILYSFGANANDGSLPNGGLVFDKAGNLYGTTQQGGSSTTCNFGCGTVFELSPSQGETWTETVIYSFCSQPNCVDGSLPLTGLVIDSAGTLYGTTKAGGTSTTCGGGCGTVFQLSSPRLPGQTWTRTTIWNFASGNEPDGAYPAGRLSWDSMGNLYGTTYFGGAGGFGSAFELSPVEGGGWTEQLLYSFCVLGPPDCSDGFEPMAGVSFDKAGNLYGTASFGGASGEGTLYELSPANGTWKQTTLYNFGSGSGSEPLAVVNVDDTGDLYTTASQANQAGGALLKFVPQPGGGFRKASLLFTNPQGPALPVSGVLLDPRFNDRIYGTSQKGGQNNEGEVYGVIGKHLISIHSFCSIPGCPDGAQPIGSLTYHSGGVYSTASKGGDFNHGTVFEIIP